MKQRIERVLSIQQIRKSTASGSVGSKPINVGGQANNDASQTSFHLAVCATIVEDFPHEELWKRWMTSTTIDIPNNINSSNDNAEEATNTISCSSELYIHAKHAKQILNSNSSSSYLKSKLLPFSHTPNWNDVRVIRAMLSLLQQALQDDKTTHVIFCTESCIPIVTLGEAARSILLDEVCVWEEKKKKDGDDAAASSSVDDRKEEGMQKQPL